MIFKLEPVLFNEPFVLSAIIDHVEAGKIKRYLSYRGEFPILKDKQFLLSCAKNMNAWRLGEWISTFYEKEDLDKEFIKDLARTNKLFLDRINSEKDPKLSDYFNDKDITIAALEGGLSPRNINDSFMMPLL